MFCGPPEDAGTGIEAGQSEAASTSDASPATYSSLCPNSSLAGCPVASDANCSNAFVGCGLDALPTGLACLAPAQCTMLIQPIAGCGRTDGYVCSCIGGKWSCDDCNLGTASCEAGVAD
jgi:hypothetical protein